MKEIADSYGWEIITQGMETDHYHILICVQPRWSPAKVVEKLKSNSAKGVFRRFPDVKNRLWGWRVLGGWILYNDSRQRDERRSNKEVYRKARHYN